MADTKYTPRLKTEYQERIRAALKEQFGYTNEMQIPKLDKIVLNMGIGEAVADSKKANAALKDLTAIAGQKAVPTKARNSIAGFKLRENMPIGTADEVIKRLKVYEDLGYDEYSFWIDTGMSFERKKASLERFIRDVMPAFA